VLDQIGDLLEARGDVDGALGRFPNALAIEPNHDIEAKAGLVRSRRARRLPDQYRAIDGAAEVTRAIWLRSSTASFRPARSGRRPDTAP